MKTIFLAFIIFASLTFGQSGKSVLTQAQKDSINAMIESYVDTSSSGVNYKTFEYYGAVGDGITNDSAAVVNAFKSGESIKGISGKTYLVNNATVITLTGYDIDLSSTGSEPFTIRFGNLVYGFNFRGTQKATGNLLADSVIIGAEYQVFTSVADVDTGDMIVYLSPAGDYWTGMDTSYHEAKFDLHLVHKISNDTVWTDVATWDTYDAYDGSHPATVYVYTPITVKIKNVNFEYTGSTNTDDLLALRLHYAKFSLLEDITVNYSRYSGIQLWYNYQSQIIRPRINYCDKAGLGYGIYLAGSFGCLVKDGYFNECRSATDGGQNISRSNIIRNNVATTSKSIVSSRGFSTHLQTQSWVIEGNTVYNAYRGIIVAGEGHIIKNNYIYNTASSSIYLGECKNPIIDGNISNPFYGNPNYYLGSVPAMFLRITADAESDATSKIVVKNNTTYSYNSFIYLEKDVYNLLVSGNDISYKTSVAYLVTGITDGDTVYYANIKDNIISKTSAYSSAQLSTNVTFLDSYTEYDNSIYNRISGDWIFDGNVTIGGTDIDSLANVASYLNVVEDTTITSLVDNGTCEGVYTAGVAPNVGLSSVGLPYTYITGTEETGISGSAQGFSSDAQLSNGNIRWNASGDLDVGVLYKLTFYAKIISNATTHRIVTYINNDAYSSPFTITTSYQKFSYNFTLENAITTGENLVYFGNYLQSDSAIVFALDNIEIRPVQSNITYTNINLDSTLVLTDIDSIPYLPAKPKLGSIGGELKAKDSAGNEFNLTSFPPVTISSDSTTCTTGQIYFDATGILRRKY